LDKVSEADFARANILLFNGGTLNAFSNCPDLYLRKNFKEDGAKRKIPDLFL
jgi:hypothetical protein